MGTNNARPARSRDAPSAKSSNLPPKPSAEDLKGSSVQRAVLAETIQHPATILPAAGSVLALAWTVAIAASPASIGLALGGVVFGASAWIYNYVVKGEDRAVARVKELRRLRREYALIELAELERKCNGEDFELGAKEARELAAAYGKLLVYLQDNEQKGSSIERFLILAEDTYKQGLSALTQAFDINTALESVDLEILESELKTWQKERKKHKDGSTTAETLDQQIAAHSKRIQFHGERQEKLAQLIAQVDQIESALETTYLELVDLGHQDPATILSDDSGAAQRLQSAVSAARRVEERLRGNDSADAERIDKYLRTAEQADSQQSE